MQFFTNAEIDVFVKQQFIIEENMKVLNFTMDIVRKIISSFIFSKTVIPGV